MSLASTLRGLFTRNATSTTSQPANWFVTWLRGETSDAGIGVTVDTALTYAAVFQAVRLISTDVGKLPLLVYQRDGSARERATEHPAWFLLRRRPNEFMSALTFRQTLQAQALLRGNGYAFIERSPSGRPIALLPLDAANTLPERRDGVLRYRTRYQLDGRTIEQLLPAADVLHVRGLSPDGITGYSVIRYARDTIGLGLQARKFGSKFFANGAKPSVVIEHPARLSPAAAENLRRSWNDIHSGADNAHKVAILEEGMKLNPFSVSNEDAQFLQTREFEIREVATWFGLPPHKLGDTTRTAYASLEQENQAYLDECLDGWLGTWEEECALKLLADEEVRQDTHFVEFTRQALVRANMTERYSAYASAIQSRWMLPNEVRERENLNPLEDGDQFPINVAKPPEQPADQVDPEDDPEADDAEDAADAADQADQQDAARTSRLLAAQRGLVVDAAGRAIRRLTLHARRAAEKPPKFLEWLEGFRGEHERTVAEMLRPVCVACAAAIGDDEDRTGDIVEGVFNTLYAGLDNLASTVTRERLARAVEAFCSDHEARGPEKLADAIIRKDVSYSIA